MINNCKICSKKLGNRNKYGYCQEHKISSSEFKEVKKKQRKIVQAKYYSQLSKDKKIKLQQRTQQFKDSKKKIEDLIKLNAARQLSHEDRKNISKNNRKTYNKMYEKTRLACDNTFKVSKNLRSRLSKAVRNKSKTGSAILHLGCSIDFLLQYLENLFYNNPITSIPMTWDNYGRDGWHIDHIIPLCSFDLTNKEQLIKACHYTNLQPLWREDNMVKISQDKKYKKEVQNG